MSTPHRVLILPGRGNSGDRHWQSVWEQDDPSLIRVQQRVWDNPNLADWVTALNAAINTEQSPVILVAHSLAVVLVAHWARKHTGPVVGALLVSPTDVEREDYPPGVVGFTPIPLEPLPFRSIVVASTDDPRVTVERATFFARAWGARLQIPGAFGHLGAAADLGEWPFGAQLLRQLRQQSRTA